MHTSGAIAAIHSGRVIIPVNVAILAKSMESHSRSLAKAISYRIFGSASTALIIFFFTRNTAMSLGGGLLDSIVKLALYFMHERLWVHIRFGHPDPLEYEIQLSSPQVSRHT